MSTSAIQIQLARLFGSSSKEASNALRTPQEWKKTLGKTVEELYRYVRANVETDELHWLMICSCFAAAKEALKESEFWPSYTEAITRLSLLLLGDYPDHRKRKGGAKSEDHYRLNRLRKLHYLQDQDQRVKVLLAAHMAGFPKLSISPRDALSEFRAAFGFKASFNDFMDWYKKTYPNDYVSLF